MVQWDSDRPRSTKVMLRHAISKFLRGSIAYCTRLRLEANLNPGTTMTHTHNMSRRTGSKDHASSRPLFVHPLEQLVQLRVDLLPAPPETDYYYLDTNMCICICEHRAVITARLPTSPTIYQNCQQTRSVRLPVPFSGT